MNNPPIIQAAIAGLCTRFPGLRTWTLRPAFISLLFLLAGIAVASMIHPTHLMIVYHRGLLPAILLITIAALTTGRKTLRNTLFFTAGVLLMVHALSEQAEMYNRCTNQGFDRGDVFACGTVSSVPMKRATGWRYTLRCDSLYNSTGSTLLYNRTVNCFAADSISPGSRVLASGRFSLPRRPAVPGAFDEYTWMLSSGLWGTLFVRTQTDLDYPKTLFTQTTTYMRSKVYALLSRVKNEGRRALLQAAFLGDKTIVPQELSDLFRNAGISHLLAISGQNVAIMASVMVLLLFFIPINRRLKIVIIIAGLWWFLFKIGVIPSLFRAVVMASVVLLTWVVQRKNYPLNSLGTAGIVWLYLSPQSLFTPGFQLSFAATFAIIEVYAPLSRRLKMESPFLKWIVRPFAEAFILSAATYLVTLPIMLYHFATLSLAGIVVNIVAVILMSVSMWAILAGITAQIAVPVLAGYCAVIADWFLLALIKVAQVAVSVPLSVITTQQPYPEMILAYAIAGMGILLASRQLRIRFASYALPALLILIPASLLIHHVFDPPRMAVFEVKKGSCSATAHKGNVILSMDVNDSLPTAVYDRQIVPWMRQAHVTSAPVLSVKSITARNKAWVQAFVARTGATTVISSGSNR